MSFLKNILGAFVEVEEDKTNGAQQNKVKSSPANPSAEKEKLTDRRAAEDTFNSSGSSTASVAKYQKHFQELIEEANNSNSLFQGTDFKEFVDSKSDVEGIADEATRYRTAFNVLKRTGLTKDKLVTTGREYLNIVDRDIKAFESVYLDQYKTQVGQKEQLLQQKAQELQTLTEKIESLNNEMKQMSQEIVAGKERLTANRSSFVVAGENIKKEIETELKKIDEYFS